MNLSIPDIVIFGIGTILVYSGVKGINPVDLTKNILQGKGVPSNQQQLPLTPGVPPREPFIHLGGPITISPSTYTPPTSV